MKSSTATKHNMSDDDTSRDDPFDKGSSIRRLVIFGSIFSILASLVFFAGGLSILMIWNGSDSYGLLYFMCGVSHEVPSLALNLIVTACTECAGVVHSRTLRFALFQERRARYNSNLRLLTGSDTKPMNSALINGLMTFLLIISYSSSSFIYRDLGLDELCGILAVPAIVLGISIFLQTCISLFALRGIDIPTWNTSPFDTIPALRRIHHPQCLKEYHFFTDPCTCVGTPPDATKSIQPLPSAWNTRKGVRVAIYLLWGLGIACMFWGLWVYLLPPEGPSRSWAIVPGFDNVGAVAIAGEGQGMGISFGTWLSMYTLMIITQGSVTLGLHCAELVADVVRGETIWRRGKQGSNSSVNSSFSSWFYALFLCNWLHIVLFCAKPFLHWLFGLAVEIYVVSTSPGVISFSGEMSFYFAPIFYLASSLFVVAIIFTLAACHHPKGAKPTTYGRIKTLLDLDDGKETQSLLVHESQTCQCNAD